MTGKPSWWALWSYGPQDRMLTGSVDAAARCLAETHTPAQNQATTISAAWKTEGQRDAGQ